eukprot:4047769-Alexandrium_andersonii.AAC.1
MAGEGRLKGHRVEATAAWFGEVEAHYVAFVSKLQKMCCLVLEATTKLRNDPFFRARVRAQDTVLGDVPMMPEGLAFQDLRRWQVPLQSAGLP